MLKFPEIIFCFIGAYLRSTTTHLCLYSKHICLTLVPSNFYQKSIVFSPVKFCFSLREYILDCTIIFSLNLDSYFNNCFDSFSLRIGCCCCCCICSVDYQGHSENWWMLFESLNLFLES